MTTLIRNLKAPPIRHGLVRTLLSLPCAFFWLGVLWFALGTVITFVPGGEQTWFTVVGLLTTFGFFVPKRRYRIAAVVFISLSTFAAVEGHKRGIEYRQTLEHRKAPTPSPDHIP